MEPKIDLEPLYERAFYAVDVVANASRAILEASRRYQQATGGGIGFEVVVPEAPDRAWLLDRLVRPLVYFCESSGEPLPDCPAVFVSLFAGARLYCVASADVIAWVREQLGLSAEELRRRYGTQELGTAPR